jgi:hypothetical protein
MPTLRRESRTGLRPIIGQVLKAYGVQPLDDIGQQLKLEDALAGAAYDYLIHDELDAPAEKTGNAWLDGIFDPNIRRLMQIREDVQHDLRLTIDFDDDSDRFKRWYGFDKWLLQEEKKGRLWAEWIRWYKADDFRAKGIIYLKQERIKEIWLQAFSQGEEIVLDTRGVW